MRKEGIAKPLNADKLSVILQDIQENSAFAVRDKALVLVSFRSGLRVGEIASLVWDDILTKNGEIKETFSLRKATTKGKKGGLAFFTHPELRSALSDLLAETLSVKSICEGSTTSVKSICREDPVFRSRKGGAFSNVSLSRLFTNTYARAGMEGLSSHSGRKGLCKALNEANVNVYNIQKVLRHSSISTTINHYISVDEDLLANMVKGV